MSVVGSGNTGRGPKLMAGDTVIAIACDPDDIVAELAGVRPGHQDIPPARPSRASQLRCHLIRAADPFDSHPACDFVTETPEVDDVPAGAQLRRHFDQRRLVACPRQPVGQCGSCHADTADGDSQLGSPFLPSGFGCAGTAAPTSVVQPFRRCARSRSGLSAGVVGSANTRTRA